jgi:hypothetical protein
VVAHPPFFSRLTLHLDFDLLLSLESILYRNANLVKVIAVPLQLREVKV